METKFDYTKWPVGKMSGYEIIGQSLNETKSNIDWESLNESQIHLANKLIDSPNYFPNFSEFKLLNELAALTNYLWEQNKELMVYFIEGDDEKKEKTIRIANEWYKYGNIKFVLTEDRLKSDIRVSFQNSGCWSYIGNIANTISKEEATLNIETSNLSIDGAEFRRLVLHEFGHALGLIHEHQSPAAEMDWNKPVVYRYFYMIYGWDKAKVDINLFDEFENHSIEYSELDSSSIMAYYVPPFFTKSGKEFPLNYELSDCDKILINKIYPKNKELITG